MFPTWVTFLKAALSGNLDSAVVDDLPMKLYNCRPMATQLEFKKVNGWGGKRKGAGRPNKTGRVSHMKRVQVKASVPMHVTWRLREGVAKIRRLDALDAFKRAAENAKAFDLRLLHFSILNNHLHMVVEANSNRGLARGMKSFGSSFGKAVRKMTGGRGSVFDGRYHLRLLTTPTETKNALAYVLQNFAKHEDLLNHLDRYSSAQYFGAWRKLLGKKSGPLLEDSLQCPQLPKFLSAPRSWLAKEGWTRAARS